MLDHSHCGKCIRSMRSGSTCCDMHSVPDGNDECLRYHCYHFIVDAHHRKGQFFSSYRFFFFLSYLIRTLSHPSTTMLVGSTHSVHTSCCTTPCSQYITVEVCRSSAQTNHPNIYDGQTMIAHTHVVNGLVDSKAIYPLFEWKIYNLLSVATVLNVSLFTVFF